MMIISIKSTPIPNRSKKNQRVQALQFQGFPSFSPPWFSSSFGILALQPIKHDIREIFQEHPDPFML